MSEKRTPEEVLKAMGAQIVLGEWRFPFYGKDTVAQMLPLEEWIERRRRIGHSLEALLKAAKLGLTYVQSEEGSNHDDSDLIKKAIAEAEKSK